MSRSFNIFKQTSQIKSYCFSACLAGFFLATIEAIYFFLTIQGSFSWLYVPLLFTSHLFVSISFAVVIILVFSFCDSTSRYLARSIPNVSSTTTRNLLLSLLLLPYFSYFSIALYSGQWVSTLPFVNILLIASILILSILSFVIISLYGHLNARISHDRWIRISAILIFLSAATFFYFIDSREKECRG